MSRHAVSLFIILVLGLLTYSGSFHVPFQFDDYLDIVNNPNIRSLDYFLDSSRVIDFGRHGYVRYFHSRIVGYATFAFNYKVHGLTVTGYHAVNFLIHIINAFLAYVLVCVTVKKVCPEPSDEWRATILALVTSCIFAVHPVQTQAVVYIKQRLVPLSTMFYFAALLSYIQSRSTVERASPAEQLVRYAWYALSLACVFLAMKTKEIAFTVPFIILLYDIFFLPAQSRLRQFLRLLPFFLMLAVIPLSLAAHSNADISGVTKVQTDLPRLTYLITELRVIMTYIRLLFFPAHQNLDYDYPIFTSIFNLSVIASLLCIALILGIAVYIWFQSRTSRRHLRIISFGIFWFFITLSVESSIIPIVDVINEHRLYLPLFGATLSVISTVHFMLFTNNHRATPKLYTFASICLAVTGILSAAAFLRIQVWKDPRTLWQDVVEKSPRKERGHSQLGVILSDRGYYDEALAHFETALALNPSHATIMMNLGVVHARKGDFDLAITIMNKAIVLNPNDSEIHAALGAIYYMAGFKKEALLYTKSAVRLNPNNETAHRNLHVIFKDSGESYLAMREMDTLKKLSGEPESH